MSDDVRARLTGRALRFIQLLQDYGHLDEAQADDLLVALAAVPGGVIDLPAVRRVAAAWLFEAHPEGQDGADVLAEDWALLFY